MVDQRSAYEGLRELALFAGAGGGILGGQLLGWRTVCAVEWEPYPASVLCARQNEGILPPFPIWNDVQTFDGNPWRGLVDVVSGGFPCQDISIAGKGAGINGGRSGMWGHMVRIISEVRPRFAFMENSPMLVQRGLARVLSDLAEVGYDARWTCLSAGDIGSCIEKNRIWILAHPRSMRAGLQRSKDDRGAGSSWPWREEQPPRFLSGESWLESAKRGEYGSPGGDPAGVDRIKATGNIQVPAVAATAFILLHERLRHLSYR